MTQNKQGMRHTPRLRFPEFRNAPVWEKKKLGELAKPCKEKNKSFKYQRVLTNSAEFGIVDQRDFFDKDIANSDNIGGYYLIKKGDYVYNPRISKYAPTGPIFKNELADGIMSPLYTVFRFYCLDNDFYRFYFKSDVWSSSVLKESNQGARHDRINLSNSEFMNLPLFVPSLLEQKKIADCLSCLDELIEATGQKVEQLRKYKKGLMQRLFPKEGETKPSLRFPEFQNAPVWEEKAFSEIFIVKNQKNTQTLVSNYLKSGKTPIIDQGKEYISGYTNSEVIYDVTPVVLFGDHTRAVKWVDFPFSPGADGTQVFQFHTNVFRKFAYYLLQNIELPNLGYSRHMRVLKEKILSLPFFVEQKKIADYLSCLDEWIEATSQKAERLKHYKKGLMQKLFPA